MFFSTCIWLKILNISNEILAPNLGEILKGIEKPLFEICMGLKL